MVQEAAQHLDQEVPVQEVVGVVQENLVPRHLTVVEEVEGVIVIDTTLQNPNTSPLILPTVESYQKIMDCSMPIWMGQN